MNYKNLSKKIIKIVIKIYKKERIYLYNTLLFFFFIKFLKNFQKEYKEYNEGKVFKKNGKCYKIIDS